MIHPTQDPKYGIKNNRLVNMATGEPIPDDEPIMIFRAKDIRAAYILTIYASLCRNLDHRHAVNERCRAFKKFAASCPERMKEPDTVIGKGNEHE